MRTYGRHFVLRRFYVETTLGRELNKIFSWRVNNGRLGFILDRARNGGDVERASAEWEHLQELCRAREEVLTRRLARVRAMEPAT